MDELKDLKSQVYDLLAVQQQIQAKMNELNQKISELVKAEQDKPKE